METSTIPTNTESATLNPKGGLNFGVKLKMPKKLNRKRRKAIKMYQRSILYTWKVNGVIVQQGGQNTFLPTKKQSNLPITCEVTRKPPYQRYVKVKAYNVYYL